MIALQFQCRGDDNFNEDPCDWSLLALQVSVLGFPVHRSWIEIVRFNDGAVSVDNYSDAAFRLRGDNTHTRLRLRKAAQC